VKDIYSPLDIDEEWDDITPDMAGSVAVLDNPNTQAVTKLAVTSEEAPDLSGNDGTSTLAPAAEVTAEAPAEMPNTNMAQGLKESTEEDAAFKVANTDMGMDSAPAKTDGTLNIGEINPATTAAASTTDMAMPNTDTEVPKADAKVTTPIPVIDMNEANSTPAAESITMPGESFTPEEIPTTGDRFEGMKTEEKEAPKAAPANTEEPAAAELPVTHADKKATFKADKGDSGSKMKFDMGDSDKAMESFEKESDAQDNKFINMIKETQARALEGLNHEIEILQNTLADQDKDLEERNAKRDMTQVNLNKLNDEKSKVEGYL
jgi:hypothetical protein